MTETKLHSMIDNPYSPTDEDEKPVTIGELNSLWMGHPDTGSKTLRFKDWDVEQEEELSEILQDAGDKFDGGRVGKRASYILQHLAAEIGGVVLWEEKGDSWESTMPLPQRLATISNLWTVDVLTAYILLRIHAGEDPNVGFPIPDPFDRKGERTVDWRGDLSQLPFDGSPNVEDQLWEYQLKHPTKINGKVATKFVMGPTRWAVTEQLEILNHHQRRMNLDQLAGSIWEIPDVLPNRADGNGHVSRTTYTRKSLRKLKKVDVNALVDGINSKHNGPDATIEVFDSEKGRTFESSVPWYRPDFFDVTSQ